MSACNADYRHPCDVNDGQPCAECAAYLKESAAEAWRLWEAASPQERDPEKYEQELIDAGRGHLVRSNGAFKPKNFYSRLTAGKAGGGTWTSSR